MIPFVTTIYIFIRVFFQKEAKPQIGYILNFSYHSFIPYATSLYTRRYTVGHTWNVPKHTAIKLSSVETPLNDPPLLIFLVPSLMGFGLNDPSAAMRDFLRQAGGCAVMDGGLATELEANGADLNDPLWSAKCLISSPDLIRKVHLDYLEAGANIIISASYQATIQGFEARGFSKEESEALLFRSVKIACEARDIFQSSHPDDPYTVGADESILRKHPILVAASIGSYGAFLADGSEYSGDYGKEVTLQTLKDFHRRRLQVLAESGADLMAFETIPNKIEAEAYAELLEENNIRIPAWFSFSSKDENNVVSGDSVLECVAVANACKNVVAVGINCTPPRYIQGLILSIRKVTDKLIVVYPNSGERYDADRKEWVAATGIGDEDFVSYVSKWSEAGASLIGGCCRTTPRTIKAIAEALFKVQTVF